MANLLLFRDGEYIVQYYCTGGAGGGGSGAHSAGYTTVHYYITQPTVSNTNIGLEHRVQKVRGMRPTPNCSAGFGFNGVWVAGQRTLRKLLERGRAKIPHNFAFQSAKRRPVAQCIKINNKQKQFILKKISYVYSFSVVDNIFQSVWLYVCYKLLYIPKEKHIRGKRI